MVKDIVRERGREREREREKHAEIERGKRRIQSRRKGSKNQYLCALITQLPESIMGGECSDAFVRLQHEVCMGERSDAFVRLQHGVCMGERREEKSLQHVMVCTNADGSCSFSFYLRCGCFWCIENTRLSKMNSLTAFSLLQWMELMHNKRNTRPDQSCI